MIPKTDKTGQMCTDKHIYANPLEPTVCPFLALAVFFSLESLHLSESEKFFQLDGQTTAASQRYCGQLSELFKGNGNNLQGYIRADHANSHGIRKGSATKVTLERHCLPQHHPSQPKASGPSVESWISIGILPSQETTTWVAALQVLIRTQKTLPFSPPISPLAILWRMNKFVRR